MCFNSSSHKPNPTLTPIHKALVDRDGNRFCPACKQPWLTETVTKDEESRKWVVVRPQPKIHPLIDYQLCVNIRKKRQLCRNGAKCTYAHSMVELKEWNRKRYQQPRSAPDYNLHGPYQMCKNVQTTGICQQQCKYAHSKEELQQWNKHSVNKRRKTNRRSYWSQTPRRMNQSSFIRPCPNIVVNHRYKLCKSVQFRRPCYYGDNCTFAHSKKELQQWNDEILSRVLDYSSLVSYKQRALLDGHESSDTSAYVSGDDSEDMMSTRSENFDQMLRAKVILPVQSQKEIPEFKV